MTADSFGRPERNCARDRRRILALLCAFTVASFVWIHVRHPLQRTLASSSIGNFNRTDLVLRTIRSSNPQIAEYSGVHWSSRSHDGPPLVAVSVLGGYELFDASFDRVARLPTAAGFASPAADRDHDGLWEFAMILYGLPTNNIVWFVLRRNAATWELIAVSEVDALQRPASSVGARWVTGPDGMPEWQFVQHTFSAAASTSGPTIQEVTRFAWTRPAGILRAPNPHALVHDCMPGDEPIPIADGSPLDPIIEKLVNDAANQRPRPLGSQSAGAPQSAPSAP
jgi:hypothetical protein